MGAIVWAVALRRGRKGETTTLRSQSSNQSIMMEEWLATNQDRKLPTNQKIEA